MRFPYEPLPARHLRLVRSDAAAPQRSNVVPLRIGASFRSKSGGYCRTFTLGQGAALAGLACRATAGWQLEVLVHAASSMPPALEVAVNSRIAGAPLDARAEVAACRRHWLPPERGGRPGAALGAAVD